MEEGEEIERESEIRLTFAYTRVWVGKKMFYFYLLYFWLLPIYYYFFFPMAKGHNRVGQISVSYPMRYIYSYLYGVALDVLINNNKSEIDLKLDGKEPKNIT